MDNIDFKYLRYAITVAECGSITKASQKLFIAQPNLSRAISELEKDLGFPLFVRTKKGMYPTPAGEHFLAKAGDLVAKLTALVDESRENARRDIRFASIPASLYFYSVLNVMNERQDYRIRCKEYNDCNNFFMQVIKGESDAGFLLFSKTMRPKLMKYMEEKGLSYHFLAESPMYVILNQNSPLAASGLDPEAYPWEKLHVILNTSYFEPMGIRGTAGLQELPQMKGRISGYSRAGNLDLLDTMNNLVMLSCVMHSRLLERNHLLSIPYRPDVTVYEYGYITRADVPPSKELKQILEVLADAILREFT